MCRCATSSKSSLSTIAQMICTSSNLKIDGNLTAKKSWVFLGNVFFFISVFFSDLGQVWLGGSIKDIGDHWCNCHYSREVHRGYHRAAISQWYHLFPPAEMFSNFIWVWLGLSETGPNSNGLSSFSLLEWQIPYCHHGLSSFPWLWKRKTTDHPLCSTQWPGPRTSGTEVGLPNFG